LGIEKSTIGIDSNFFELGGHSLRATVLISRIHKELNVKVPLAEIFKTPTIKQISLYLENSKKNIYEDIKPVEKREYYPQSSAQKRHFFLEQLDEIGTSYNISYVLKVQGEMVPQHHENTFKGLIRRHETLRTSFELIDNEPVQRVYQQVDFKIEQVHLPDKDKMVNNEHIQKVIKDFIRPFALSKAPLLRAGLMKLSQQEYLLLFDTHHIISDGTSMTILTQEFIQLFSGSQLLPLKIQYKDFSIWQNNLFKSGEIKKQEEYWMNLYGDTDNIPILNLPTDYPRQDIFNFEGAAYHFQLEPEDSSAFKELAKENGATLYMNLLAAFNVLLHKYTRQDDIIVGTGIAGRPHDDLKNIFGMFVNTLAIRNYPEGEKTYLEFLKEVKDNCVKAFENQDMQFEELVTRINLDRTAVKNPIFSVELNVHNYERPVPARPAVEKAGHSQVTHYGYENTTSKFDMILFATEVGEKISFMLEYSTALFKAETIEKMARRYIQIIKQVKENKTIKIKEIKISHDLLVARPAEISAELQL
ncbi:MAG: non-ribosomal peptide synthetase, partial [Candidatus Aminicenantes bacterium]